ncbi:sensor histidine kinase [Streptomyces griseoaurantiacus]|uniref:sensor histidine kinase n=1 Tax=Streptomyces griseoaurantiacus TaxID=68213 RepID=UPI0006801ABF|nr:HAMP domain-containing sensor histidine kinase [Streptomyces griseoaurantiacus]
MRLPFRPRFPSLRSCPVALPRRLHSLRAQLTLANVALLAVGVIAATAVSLMGTGHYLLGQIDTHLMRSRDSLGESHLTLHQLDNLGATAVLREGLVPQLDGSATPDDTFAMVDGHGTVLEVAGLRPTRAQRALAAAVGDPAPFAAAPEPRDLTLNGAAYRATASRLDDGTYVLFASSTDALDNGIHKALKLDLTVGGLLLALLAFLTMFQVRRRMRPLEDMVETSSAIAEGDLTRRVPSRRETSLEVEQLRLALNSMLHQVESAYRTRERSAAQLRRFVADASHELRTPLSAIRGYLQLYDRGILTDPDERKRAWERMNGEVDRMGRLVDELLTLARLDQRPELRLRNVDVSRLVRDAAEDLRAQQPDRPVTVSASGALLVRADESGLRQVLGNLVANVRAHTPPDVPVRLDARRSDGTVRLTVADEGPGLPEEDAARMFDRFFRTGSSAGSGLGLAIVQGVIEAHCGDVTATTAPDEGLTVTVVLPAGVPGD